MDEDTVALPIINCQRCGARYVARTTRLPGTCAKCRSPEWNKPVMALEAACPVKGCGWSQKFRSQNRAEKLLKKHILKTHGLDELLRIKFGTKEEDDEVRND